MPEEKTIEEHRQNEKSLVTAGQRRVNILWEITQSIIALSVTLASLFVAGSLALNGEGDKSAFVLISNAFFLIVGFYFGRTNHQKTGGIGSHDEGR